MTPEEKTNKIADLALKCGRLRRERDAALALCAGCEECAGRAAVVEVEGWVTRT